ncbi:MAG TPA: hypothetical protein VJR26_06075 [Candidatus Acidoferrales bacterium]|nr:hypothetical protein [Candidatus Acidoferrales bacterium]
MSSLRTGGALWAVAKRPLGSARFVCYTSFREAYHLGKPASTPCWKATYGAQPEKSRRTP